MMCFKATTSREREAGACRMAKQEAKVADSLPASDAVVLASAAAAAAFSSSFSKPNPPGPRAHQPSPVLAAAAHAGLSPGRRRAIAKLQMALTRRFF